MTAEQKRNYLLFMLQMNFSMLVYILFAVWYAAPYLKTVPIFHALTLMMIPQAMRHLGMTVLTKSVVDENIPRGASYPIAYGDLAAAVAAVGALIALRYESGMAIPLVWIATIIGILDLLNAFRVATKNQLTNYYLGGFWYVPTFVVPFLFVTLRTAIQDRGGLANNCYC